MFGNCLPARTKLAQVSNEEVFRKATAPFITSNLLACQNSNEKKSMGLGQWPVDPLRSVYESYSLKERMVMYARDLRMLHLSLVKASICDDPVLLPCEYFTSEERHVVLNTEEEGRTYRRMVEELLLDKRGHFTTRTDILPIVQRVFAIGLSDLDSEMAARRHSSFHRDYKRAKRIEASRLPFGEHSF